MSDTQSSPPAPGTPPTPGEIPAPNFEASCRLPLLILFTSAAAWLVIGSAFGLISSIKFHAPGFLADCATLTYGRVRPAWLNSLVYGFCLQAGLGVALWLFVHLGRAKLAWPGLVTFGAILWNLGVTIGILGILAGDATGFEYLDMPRYAALLVFIAYLLVGVPAVLTFHRRRELPLFVSQWFLFTALFWFSWIYSTANLLLLLFPVRGVAQAVLAWWFANNLTEVWLPLVGLAIAFYFVTKLTSRELHSHYLALFTFWLLVLCASWGGIPNSAPVPAWMPTVSTIATVLGLLTLIAVGLNVFQTVGDGLRAALTSVPLLFILFGIGAFLVAGLMRVLGAFIEPDLHFTWFAGARAQLQTYGFFALVVFGAVYAIMPKLIGLEFPYAKLVRAHFWMAALGIVLIFLPLALGGIFESVWLRDSRMPFVDVSKRTLMFLRVSTIGDLLLLAGHLMFLVNLAGLACRFYAARAITVYEDVTEDLFKTAEAKT